MDIDEYCMIEKAVYSSFRLQMEEGHERETM